MKRLANRQSLRLSTVVVVGLICAGGPTAAAAGGIGDRLRSTVPTEDVMCAGPFQADNPGVVPGDGPATVGEVDLPAGRQVADGRFWITNERVDSAYARWADLAAAFPETGLWPVLWVVPQLGRLTSVKPAESTADAEELLASEWNRFAEIMDEDFDDYVEPLGHEFPGLTPEQTVCRYNAVERARTVHMSPQIALVPVRRPADVPEAIGWNDTRLESPNDVSTILRSWEDRVAWYP